MTEEQRLAVIAKAVADSKSIKSPQFIEDFIAEVKTEEIVAEHGLLDNQKIDLEDEFQFLLSESAEEIDEEDGNFGISQEMKNTQKQG
jgi:hypothetical protein